MACSEGFSTDTEDAPEQTACTGWVAETWPVNGAAGVYYRDVVRFTLSEPIPEAEEIVEPVAENNALPECE